MITRSRIISGASGLAGEPPNGPLPSGVPEWLRFETAADLETELIRDLNLSSENRTLASTPVNLTLDSQDFTVPGGGAVETVAYVSVVTSDLQPPWITPQDVDITNLSLINDARRDGKLKVAFYSDRPQQGRVSWIPQGNEVLTIWYDKSPQTDPSPDQSTFTITDSYLPLLKLLLAAQMLELMNKPIGAMLQSRITRGLEQWREFVNRTRNQGVIQKTAWRPGRYMERGRGPWTSEFPVR